MMPRTKKIVLDDVSSDIEKIPRPKLFRSIENEYHKENFNSYRQIRKECFSSIVKFYFIRLMQAQIIC